MEETLNFIYNKEFWLMSAFINKNWVNMKEKIAEIKKILNEKLKNLSKNDLEKINWNPTWQEKVIELGKNITFDCRWVPVIENFPYIDENTSLHYNSLGYFEFEVEYFKNEDGKKESIKPVLIQQIPTLVKEELVKYSSLIKNRYLFLDEESPIYDFVTSCTTTPTEVEWNTENIEKYKKVLGYWTEIYSGSWKDYNENLYDRRIQKNLSNRLSELHFIRRNSAFIYMKKENFDMFFEGYMKNFVLDPIPQIRAIIFALMSINGSLDILFMRQAEDFMDLDAIEEKINNLRQLRGMIQTELSVIQNELDYNRRQHYTSVLEHLINEFNLDGMITRIRKKFDVIYDSMQLLYQKQNEENQEKAEKSMNLLNTLFSLGILADFVGLLLGAFNGFSEIPSVAYIVNGVSALLILSMFIYTMISRSKLKSQSTKKIIKRAADAVILDGSGNVVLIRRRYPPFRGQLALPGGIMEEGETPRETLIREVKEETNLKILIEKEIGIYDAEGRDPRGPVISTAFLCSIAGDIGQFKLKGGDDAITANFVSISELKEKDLAFDHEAILQDGLNAAKSIGKFK